MPAGVRILRRRLGDVRQHLAQHRRIRTGGQGAVLRAAQLRSRDHFHGLGDLLRVLDAAYAAPNVD